MKRLSDGDMFEAPLEQLVSLFEAIDEKIYVADPETHQILYVNGAMERSFGKELLGGKCHKMFQGLEEPCDFCTNPLIFGKNLGRTHVWEFKNRKTHRWRRCIDKAIRWNGGRMVRFEMAIDIHGLKVAEEALQESEKKYRRLVENIHEVIYSIDQKGTIIYVSPAIESFTGFSPSEMEGRHFSRFIFQEDFGRIVDRFQEALSGQGRPTEYRILTRTGEYRWVRSFSKPIREGHEVKGIQGVLSDITEQKEAEEELRTKAGHLEEMNAALRVLLEKRERDRLELEEKMLLNVQAMVMPYLEKLKRITKDEKQKAYLEVMESNLQRITSSFSGDLRFRYHTLTRSELQIAGLVRDGKNSKEIAELLNLSYRTVESHRKHLRKKLGLKNKKANLRTTLLAVH
jgi:PAS domain S-box-containing protein